AARFRYPPADSASHGQQIFVIYFSHDIWRRSEHHGARPSRLFDLGNSGSFLVWFHDEFRFMFRFAPPLIPEQMSPARKNRKGSGHTKKASSRLNWLVIKNG